MSATVTAIIILLCAAPPHDDICAFELPGRPIYYDSAPACREAEARYNQTYIRNGAGARARCVTKPTPAWEPLGEDAP